MFYKNRHLFHPYFLTTLCLIKIVNFIMPKKVWTCILCLIEHSIIVVAELSTSKIMFRQNNEPSVNKLSLHIIGQSCMAVRCFIVCPFLQPWKVIRSFPHRIFMWSHHVQRKYFRKRLRLNTIYEYCTTSTLSNLW